MKRRDFLLAGAGAALGVAGLGSMSGCSSYEGSAQESSGGEKGRHWGFVVDVERFIRVADIEKIRSVCDYAHNVPEINNAKEEIKWIWGEPFEAAFADLDTEYLAHELDGATIPVLCNQCERPPCVRVCPTKATFKRDDGIVEMDYHRCIGCRFCMAACPFGSRNLNFSDPAPHIKEINPDYPTRTKGVVEKCTMCSERIDKGKLPLCAEVSNGSIIFGDLNDPESEVRQILADSFSVRRRASLGTGPSVYYVLRGGETRA